MERMPDGLDRHVGLEQSRSAHVHTLDKSEERALELGFHGRAFGFDHGYKFSCKDSS